MDTTATKKKRALSPIRWSWRSLKVPRRVLAEAGTLSDLVAQWDREVATLYHGDRPATQREARVAVCLGERMRRRAVAGEQ